MPSHLSRVLSPLVRVASVALVFASAGAALAQKSPEETVRSMKVADGLEATVWASEPGMVNPTNMDIDERGRIWVLEGANYRGSRLRPEGDRIMVLEDTDQDGACDKYHVFLQDPELVSPLGVAKLGDKLFVSQSPNVLVYTIEESADGPKPAGKPEVIFTGFGGVNHDHGVHAFVFGPDGRLYFNSGNDGGSGHVKFGDGSPVVDVTGSEVGRQGKVHRGKPRGRDNQGYTDGLAFRWDPAAKKFEVLGHNFRNNYELCVDSFGTVWQSDNDDDGNESVRLNFVMEGGNFGFKGPRGTDWGRDKDVIPGQTRQEAHWHQRWPGVVPNMIHTGGGSPTGICFYEGELLPEQFRGAILHCDAGPNVVRAYIPSPAADAPKGLMTADDEKTRTASAGTAGAGYKAQPVDLIKATDTWFRPSDVCVAPDGSVFVCDWYDPGVGGHATGDKEPRQLRGRIYRLAPKGFKPSKPSLDLDSAKGQLAAFASPNMATRYLGYNKLLAAGASGAGALKDILNSTQAPWLRARALWLLARGPEGKQVVAGALKDQNADLRIAALRAGRAIGMDVAGIAKEMAGDPSIAVARELCVALQHEPNEKALPILVTLADRYDGKDRWYLEALGIGATGREDALLEAWQREGKNKDPKVAEGIAWRMKRPTPGTAEGPAAPGVSATASADPQKPAQRTKDGRVLPAPAELAKLTGNAEAGAAVFRDSTGANCVACHEVGDEGRMVGPPLTTIGQKLSKEQLYRAILYPNDALLMGYETWVVRTKSGETFAGLKTSDTPEQVTIKDTNGKYHDVDAPDVDRKVMQKVSLMPEGLAGAMTMKELVDVVEYLSTLRNRS
jgi:putative membrane-bound dehydrogenase-like protein